MTRYTKQLINKVDILYNNVLSLSRNELFYTNFNLTDTFQNRIHLIFIHITFLFVQNRVNKENVINKKFYQKTFDLIFDKIEQNMREIGYGDTPVNKSMRFLIKIFYKILLDCEKYKKMNLEEKNIFFNKFLDQNTIKNRVNNVGLIDYFNKYEDFCYDLGHDSVLKGKINFNYK